MTQSTPKSRARKRDQAARIGQMQAKVEAGAGQVLDTCEWFWSTSVGQMTLLVLVVAAVGVGGVVETLL